MTDIVLLSCFEGYPLNNRQSSSLNCLSYYAIVFNTQSIKSLYEVYVMQHIERGDFAKATCVLFRHYDDGQCQPYSLLFFRWLFL